MVAASGARADDGTAACLDAHVEAQRLRNQGKLLAARAALQRCSREDCPAVVQSSCTGWLAEVGRTLPTIVVAATGPDGEDLTAVRISIDGAVAAESIDGRPLALDPGPHKLRFELGMGTNRATIELPLVARLGEQNRLVRVDFRPPAAPRPPPVVPAEDPGISAVAVAGYAVGGVGLAGLGVFAILGAVGATEYAALEDRCAPYCTEQESDGVHDVLLAADVSLGVGAATLGAGIALVLYDHLSRSRSGEPQAPQAWSVAPGGVRLSF